MARDIVMVLVFGEKVKMIPVISVYGPRAGGHLKKSTGSVIN